MTRDAGAHRTADDAARRPGEPTPRCESNLSRQGGHRVTGGNSTWSRTSASVARRPAIDPRNGVPRCPSLYCPVNRSGPSWKRVKGGTTLRPLGRCTIARVSHRLRRLPPRPPAGPNLTHAAGGSHRERLESPVGAEVVDATDDYIVQRRRFYGRYDGRPLTARTKRGSRWHTENDAELGRRTHRTCNAGAAPARGGPVHLGGFLTRTGGRHAPPRPGHDRVPVSWFVARYINRTSAGPLRRYAMITRRSIRPLAHHRRRHGRGIARRRCTR